MGNCSSAGGGSKAGLSVERASWHLSDNRHLPRLEQGFLKAMEARQKAKAAETKGATRLSPWGLLSSDYPEGSLEAQEDLAEKAFSAAMRSLPPIARAK
jgi:hypothetical protein